MSRILIAGGPRVGKTTLGLTLSERLGVDLRSTDDLIATHAWSEASAEVARWLDEPGSFVIEGVAIPRALRKWFAAHPEGAPADTLHWGMTARVALTPGQLAMTKGSLTVWREVSSELRRRGVRIETF